MCSATPAERKCDWPAWTLCDCKLNWERSLCERIEIRTFFLILSPDLLTSRWQQRDPVVLLAGETVRGAYCQEPTCKRGSDASARENVCKKTSAAQPTTQSRADPGRSLPREREGLVAGPRERLRPEAVRKGERSSNPSMTTGTGCAGARAPHLAPRASLERLSVKVGPAVKLPPLLLLAAGGCARAPAVHSRALLRPVLAARSRLLLRRGQRTRELFAPCGSLLRLSRE